MDDEERWKARFRAARVTLPSWAALAPHRCVYRSNSTGTWEIYAWDRQADVIRQVTERPHGTMIGTVDAAGAYVWWFNDTDGDEYGVWLRRPFDGGPEQIAVPELQPAYPAGLALGRSGLVVAGRSTETGASVHIGRPAEPSWPIYQHPQDAYVVGLSHDDDLIVIGHSEHGDSRHMALRAMTPDGSPVADLWDGPGKGLNGVRFCPIPGDHRLLVVHERNGRAEPLIWDVVTREVTEVHIDLPGEIIADWYPDGTALLIAHDHQARTELYCHELTTGELVPIDTPRGVITEAAVRPDESVEYFWSSAAEPPAVHSTTGELVLKPPGAPAPPSVPVADVWVDGPDGKIHALVSTPFGIRAPYPTVFIVHGGPTAQDDDSFSPQTAMWVDHGFAVIRVNYRGSTGYGSAWRDALEGHVGLTELADIRAVRDWAVSTQLSDPDKIVLNGWSWGGYLTLLGIGHDPDAWSIGIAGVPIADYVAAYRDEMDQLQAFDRSLFGGSPDEVGERYRESSPISYVDQVRVPVLVLAGENDPRCPIRQIENYLAALFERDVDYEVFRYDAGHGSLVVAERIRHHTAELEFAKRRLG